MTESKRSGTRASMRNKLTNRIARALEPLESRLLLSADLNGTALTVTGTAGNDVIALGLVGGEINVTVNGVPDQFDVAAVASISVDAFAGNDAITIGPGLIGVSVSGGAGNDTMTSGTGNDTLVGGTGNDTYKFLDGWGNDVVSEAPAGGNDTLDFSAVTQKLLFNIGRCPSAIATTPSITAATMSRTSSVAAATIRTIFRTGLLSRARSPVVRRQHADLFGLHHSRNRRPRNRHWHRRQEFQRH